MVSIFLYVLFFFFEPDNFFRIILKCLAERCGLKQSFALSSPCCYRDCHYQIAVTGVQWAQVPHDGSQHKGVSSSKECPSPCSPDAAHLCVSHTDIHFACDIVVNSIEQCAS